MDPLARVVPLAQAGLVIESPFARVHHLAPSTSVPPGTEVLVALPTGARVAYEPVAPGEAAQRELPVDPMMRGNSFTPLHDSPRALAAALSVAAGRRVETGPESERVLVILRGVGLVFQENGDTHRFEAGNLAFLPAGEPARLWAQGPEDVLAVALQPNVARAQRRTLAGEVARRKTTGGTA